MLQVLLSARTQPRKLCCHGGGFLRSSRRYKESEPHLYNFVITYKTIICCMLYNIIEYFFTQLKS